MAPPVPPFSLDDLRDAIRSNRYRIQQHARQRRRERGYTREEILDVILTGDVIESYPTSTPEPKCLMMKHIRGEPTYVVVAYDSQTYYAYLITVHGYDPDKWVDPWTRKRA